VAHEEPGSRGGRQGDLGEGLTHGVLHAGDDVRRDLLRVPQRGGHAVSSRALMGVYPGAAAREENPLEKVIQSCHIVIINKPCICYIYLMYRFIAEESHPIEDITVICTNHVIVSSLTSLGEST
jgi:hypothetical protein